MLGNPSDFVLDLKLKTEFLDGCVRHTRYTQGSPSTESRIRVEEIWDIKSTLGRGSYGIVRLERRRPTSTPSLESPYQVRAVKEISKTVTGGNRWDYMKELETIAKFSHPRYGPYFVRTYGWFENADSVFIAMEFFPLGDLQHFMVTWPPFPEEATRQIVRQLIEGVNFMHESCFAHRDLKPGNILVKSHSPGWLVKIADFGISKRAQEGGTDLRTMHIGTFGYMAPEVLGFFSGNDPAVAYSVSIDIWAIGVISIELLLKQHPFSNVSDLVSYVHDTKQLDLVGVTGMDLSNTCRDFVSALLAPNPATRPTAGAASKHPWIAAGIPSAETEKSLFVEDDLQEVHLRARDAATPASLPSLAWSNLQLTDSLPATQPTSTLLSTYQGPQFDPSVLIPNFRNLSLDTEFQQIKTEIETQREEVDEEIKLAAQISADAERRGALVFRQEAKAFQDTALKELNQTRSSLNVALKGGKEHNRIRLLQSLTTFDHSRRFRDLLENRHPGSGAWLFEHQTVKQWIALNGPKGIWCYGIPGSGKSFLATTMIDHLMGLRMASPKKCVIYFFCDYADTDSIESATIIASLIKQILTVYPMIAAIEHTMSQNILLGDWKKKQNDLWALLQDALAIPEEIYIVIDGLDECARGELPFLASNFEDLASSSKRKVQLLLFSREMLDLPRQFSGLTRLSLDHDLISTDIGKFIDTTVKKKWSTGILNVGDDTIIDEIIMALTRGAQGMFLWVDFQIKAICDEYTDDDIRLALQNLPSDLEQTYVRALRKILKGPKSQKSQTEIARKVFNWLACARRPMLLEELREAVSVTSGQTSFIEARLINNPIRIVQACANMVTFDEKQQTVRFAHHTVKQFLCSTISEPDCKDFTIDRSKADYEAGKICVTYLNFSDFERQIAKVPQKSFLSSSTPDTVLELHQLGRVPKSPLTRVQRLHKRSVAPVDAGNILSQLMPFQSKDSFLHKQFSFLQYACQNWVFHCAGFSDSDEDSWRLFGNLVFGRILPVPYISWSEDYIQGKPQYWTQFAWAIENGHAPLARLLGSKTAVKEDYANAELQTGVLPLQMACTRGNGTVVLYLLEIGADVNAFAADYGGRTALQAAAGGGHLEIVNRLLAANADVNAFAAHSPGRTALQAAAGGGHLEVVDRLLTANADVNAAAAVNGGRTALQAAVGSGHLEIVDRLLAAKADVNAPASYNGGRTALHAAAGGGHLEIVDRLLTANADVNAPVAHNGRTALQAAAGGGHLEIVDRLLAAKADVNDFAAYNGGRTALQAAAGGGHLEVVDRLLTANADVNAPVAHNGSTALQAAAGGGHLEVVDRLLAAKAYVNVSIAGNGRTALQVAAGGGHLEIVGRLLAANADVNAGAAVNGGQTALQAAAGGGHLEVVDRLKKAGAEY